MVPHRGQSDLIGTVLLIGVVAVLVTSVGVVVLAQQADRIEADTPESRFEVEATASTLTVTHYGGASVPLADLDLLVRGGGTERRYDLDDPADRRSIDDDGDGEFDPAESVTVDHGFAGTVDVLVVDSGSNSVRYDESVTVPTPAPSLAR